MPQIKLKHVISFTSEDPKHKADNLITGNGIWLCCHGEQSGNIKAEFQLQKASVIDYIDIGNRNSAMLCIDAGMSSWPSSQKFISLLPTVALMTPPDCRMGHNSNSVRMFKKENLDKINATKQWDRIRVTCSQPFKKNTQYGLAFLKFYSKEVTIQNCEKDFREISMKETMLSSIPSQPFSPRIMSESLRSLETSRCASSDDPKKSKNSADSLKSIASPISRAGRLVMAHRHSPNEMDGKQQKKDLECEALKFLIAMNLTTDDIHSLKVSHIREEFEVRRKKTLNTREKLIFKTIALDYAAERLNKLEKENNEPLEVLSSDDENKTPIRPLKFSFKRFDKTIKRGVSGEDLKETTPPLLPGCSSKRNNLALTDCLPTTHSSSKRKLNDRFNSVECQSRSSSKLLKFGTLEDVGNKGKEDTSCLLNMIECPICTDLFSCDDIEGHASSCDGTNSSSLSSSFGSSMKDKNSTVEECPVCGSFVDSPKLKEHVEACAERNFT